MADRMGRLKDEPGKIEAEIFPFKFQRVNIEELLNGLAAGDDPFIVRYEIKGQRCLTIVNFLTHQTPHHQEANSTLLPCKKNFAPRSEAVRTDFRSYPSSSLTPDSPSLTPDSPLLVTPGGVPYPLPDPVKNPTACLVVSYKTRKGVAYDSRDWDSLNWGRCAAAAKVLLSLCKDLSTAETCLADIAKDFDVKEMTWTLETIAKHAPDWLKKHGRTNADTSRAGLRMAIAKRKAEGASEGGLVKAADGPLLNALRDGPDRGRGDEENRDG